MKRIATIQDISCFGKCSITVSLPVISAMGVECAIVPTTVLSTHTSGFTGFTVCDIADQLLPIAEHWKREGIKLDTLYTGYLANEGQINDTIRFIELTKNDNTLIFVDPAMADNGKLYPGFPVEFPSKMLELVKIADVVCPNITEACLLLGKEFKNEGEYDESYIRELVDGFVALGIKRVVITGVKYGDGRHGAMAFDVQTGEYRYLYGDNMDCYFHGTGDIFSSVLCGALTKGNDVCSATQQAVDLTIACIKQTLPDRENHPYGVKFEECLHLLTK
jgi:pyridoxine kinase